MATLRAWWIAIVNAIASALPDDPLTSRFRAYLYYGLSFRCGIGPTIKGGCRINGFGLRIGHRVFINRDCYFDLTAPILIGDNVVIGHYSRFVTADHEIGDRHRRAGAVRGAPIVVEEGVWIGGCCTILAGVTIGRGSVVAAGALVRKDVAPNTKVGGVPARVIGTLA
ncbi:DapH/DapD/GlmU-related protein [Sphingomonas sp. LR60]|uniref:acyltransferase n=1 Tax=Sphingomonas sp. LR60 TaxID=3050233 RepID=UPI002FE2AFF3